MVKYREILRLAAMGVSQNGIAFSCGCAQSTVSDVLRAARAHKVAWPLPAISVETDGTERANVTYNVAKR
jgi:hypothetical protein